MKTSTVMVCGHGRCGSSMAMQMLRAGGFPCFGEFPSFEPEEVGFSRTEGSMLPLINGMAAKVLDPQRTAWHNLSGVKVIWLDRDRNEQAKSQAKMLEVFGGLRVSPDMRRGISRSFGPDTNRALVSLKKAGANIMRLTFEHIIHFPYAAAVSIDTFIGAGMDRDAMASAVIRRKAGCAPDMSIELSLCERAAG